MVDLSVIIPTFNRSKSLRRTLVSLEKQGLNSSQFEVIVVDDGSTDSTRHIQDGGFRFCFRCIHQKNSGSAAARNRGADEANGEILVFLDDDITLNIKYLAGLLDEHKELDLIVGMGTLIPVAPEPLTPFAASLLAPHKVSNVSGASHFVKFTDCTTNNLSIKKYHFFEIGKFRDIAGDGRSLWGDVHFGYRAMQHGLEFRQSSKAICYHHDYGIQDFATALSRSYETGVTAAAMGVQSPEILAQLLMFRDKVPIRPKRDPPALIIRKLARQIASSQLVTKPLRAATSLLENI